MLCLCWLRAADEPDNAEFWGALGGDASHVAPASAGGDDAAAAAATDSHLYHISNATGELLTTEIAPEVGVAARFVCRIPAHCAQGHSLPR